MSTSERQLVWALPASLLQHARRSAQVCVGQSKSWLVRQFASTPASFCAMSSQACCLAPSVAQQASSAPHSFPALPPAPAPPPRPPLAKPPFPKPPLPPL